MARTKGPWVITWLPYLGEYDSEGEPNPPVAFIGPAEMDEAVAIAFPVGYEDYWDSPSMKANANLIAAAPDLLEACEVIHNWLGTDDAAQALPFEPPWYQQLRDAIKKAKGE